MNTNLGDTSLKKLTTARIYWLPPGNGGYIDFGNTVSYKDEPKIDRVPHMQGKKGFRRVDFELLKMAGTKKTFVLDEHFTDTILLLLLSGQFPNFSQTAITADSDEETADDVDHTVDEESLQSVVIDPPLTGRSYDLGNQGVTITGAIDDNGDPLVAGTDYVIDAAAGMLTVLQAEPVGPWTFEFTCAEVTDQVCRMFSQLLALGSFKLVEFDQFSPVPRNIETFSGQVYVTAWGENKTDGFNEFTIEVLHQDTNRTQRST